MTIESALFSYLSTKAEVVAAVGTKVFPELAPESAVLPYIVYTQLAESNEHHMLAAAGLTNVNMQIDVWSETIALQVSISEIIRNVLDGFRGAMGIENLAIRSCHLQARISLTESNTDGMITPVFRKSMDFSIWHVETVPTL